tara:strand:- start:595 stop:1398 length:804 start_codon:yes stop_codon:yes gene_type:complete
VAKKMADNKIEIDEENGLVFDSEDELYAHFQPDINLLEKTYFLKRSKDDYSEEELKKLEHHLEATLDAPDEVWLLDLEGLSLDVHAFVREIEDKGHYVALTYLAAGVPSFVFSHFATKDEKVLKEIRKGEEIPVRDQSVPTGAIEGDSLFEGDILAKGLYDAMMLLRSEKDIPEDEFQDYADMRELCVEGADEIWRSADSLGNVLVTFIREAEDEGEPNYVVVTVEDEPSGSHSLLFSFPTNDAQLLERYRHGENLQADEVVQESSH